MPKTYSTKEREEIILKLRSAANDSLMKYGVKKTTVDLLVNTVGIPKGTFYLFYPNKEQLFFEVIMEIHNKIEAEFMERLQKTEQSTTLDEYLDIIMEAVTTAMNTCIMRMMMDSEVILLMNKLPEKLLEEHTKQDNDMVVMLLNYLKPKQHVDVDVLSGAFRAVFLTLPYQRGIGESTYMASFRMLCKGLLMQIL
ncbi:MAG: TetR/AcrR family transcriptional regulator [bacterium]|nr:TetR/AcrR family transcriptional regulator [bacterium]